ncbi:MAG: NAD+ synthase [Bacteroidales bacterium]|nr:NAD+ synthase [Bacteroidales bacterium]
MKVALAQLNFIVGDFAGNTQKIIDAINRAKANGSSLVVFSELAVCGYPPLDLLEHKYFIDSAIEGINAIARSCTNIAAIFGAPVVNPDANGKNLYNAAIFCAEGGVQKIVHKALLPTYDVFDEYRHFEPSKEFGIIEYKGYRIAVAICEDLWFEQPLHEGFGKEKLYSVNPMDELARLRPDVVVNIAASPFAYNHDNIKREILANTARKYQLPIIYLNQVGGQTEIIFDGGSRIVNSKGAITKRLAFFNEDFETVDLNEVLQSEINETLFPVPDRIEKIHNAIVLGIKDYFLKLNFKSAILGLSGGIDSAVTLVLAVRALGAENVRVLLLPSKYSSEHSVVDAVKLAENLGVRYDNISIQTIFDRFESSLSGVFSGRNSDVTEENIQARIRGVLLMAVSNKFGNILLNTSNKSEAAVGYGTLYGDMAGGISVLGDVYKTDVYRLAQFINTENEIIPQNTILKPPSAELRPDQKDSDSLPGYDLLDEILFNYIELRKSVSEIIGLGFPPEIVTKVIRLVNINEYKRYQSPPVLRVSSKAFGPGRRMPLVAKYI